jgi:hypothetical protein
MSTSALSAKARINSAHNYRRLRGDVDVDIRAPSLAILYNYLVRLLKS